MGNTTFWECLEGELVKTVGGKTVSYLLFFASVFPTAKHWGWKDRSSWRRECKVCTLLQRTILLPANCLQQKDNFTTNFAHTHPLPPLLHPPPPSCCVWSHSKWTRCADSHRKSSRPTRPLPIVGGFACAKLTRCRTFRTARCRQRSATSYTSAP